MIGPQAGAAGGHILLLLTGSVLYFTAICLCSAGTIKRTAILLILLTLFAVFLFYETLRTRLKPPILELALVVLMDGLSIFYAVSGKFALYECLKVISAFCLALLLLALAGRQSAQRQAASVLEGCAALMGLVSIDLLSTRLVSTPVVRFLGLFSADYNSLRGVETGVRMTSLFTNPNVFAGCAGIGVLLGLGLAVSSTCLWERTLHLLCLFANALSFVLACSLGACLTIVPAFVVFLLLAGEEGRPGLLMLMVETLAVTLLAAFPISLTSMSDWTGRQPVPLLCLAGGAAVLCALDLGLGRRAAAALEGRGTLLLGCMALGLAGLCVFAAAACTLTTGVELSPGNPLRRAATLEPGDYVLWTRTDGGPSVRIESQSPADAVMHTSSVLYEGPLSQAAFTVPEDSQVVYFHFSASEPVRLESVRYAGEERFGQIPLGYPLLPGFAANRLQGLLANRNAAQRLVFFADGIKLFTRSPVIGRGLGAFENGIKSVQDFYYETKYVHNHYIQSLVDTGVVGLILFLGLLAVSAAGVWRSRREPLSPALGAALAFMAAHSAVEIVFSAYPYLPLAFGVFATISLSPSWKERRKLSGRVLLLVSALLAVFGVLLNCNMIAQGMNRQDAPLEDLETAICLDRFEWADHMLTYVMRTAGPETDEALRQKADGYAARLKEIDSNTAPVYLAEYYFKTGRPKQGIKLVEKYVTYVASDAGAWRDAFALLERYEADDTSIRALLDAWNAEHMGQLVLNQGEIERQNENTEKSVP